MASHSGWGSKSMDAATENHPRRNHSLLVLFGFLALALAVGFAGGHVTAPNIASWYNGLAKPIYSPPNWVFAPVWTSLYILMAVAAWRAWRIQGFKSRALALWLAQLVLNFAWSFIFFGNHAPGPAMAELIVLWVIVFFTLITFARIDKAAGWLLVPYLAWISFAGLLNYGVWQLNR